MAKNKVSVTMHVRDNLKLAAETAIKHKLYENEHWMMIRWYRDILSGEITEKDAKIMIGYDGDKPISAMIISKYIPQWVDREDQEKMVVSYVKPEYRRQGIASKMFKFGTRRETLRNYVAGTGIYGSSYFFRALDIDIKF